MKRIVKLLFSSLLFLFACVPEPLLIDDVPVAENKIVVSSAFIPEQTIAIALTRNYSALVEDLEDDTSLLQELLVRDAIVFVSVRGQNYPLLELEDGIYGSTELPYFLGEVYQLEITDPRNGSKVEAQTTLMPLVNFQNLQVKPYITNNDTFPNILATFSDPADKNWYMINVQFFENDPDLESFLDARVFTYLFTDESNPSGTINQDFVAFVGREVEPGDSIVVALTNISEAYYNFLEKRRGRSFAFDLVSEPFNLPTNVSNGYGYFNIHQQDVRIVEVRE